MTLTEARNNKRGFAGLRTKRTEIPVGTPWNCLHSFATNANFFTIRAQGLRFTYPNQLALQCETQFSFDRTGKFHKWYRSGTSPIGGLYGTYHLLREPGNSIDFTQLFFLQRTTWSILLLSNAITFFGQTDKKA